MKRLIYGVGINDSYHKTEWIDDLGKRAICPYYRKWKNMLCRVYSKSYLKRNPTYKDATIEKEWHTFTNFKRWMITQDWEDKELDKDILFPNNNHYSPNTCCFVSRKLNGLLVSTSKIRGLYPIGVDYEKRRKHFRATIKINGKQKYLGSFQSANDAHIAYIIAKIAYIKTFYSGVNDRIKEGLERHCAALSFK